MIKIKKRVFCCVILVIGFFSPSLSFAELETMLMIKEDFVKFGKKEVYEQLQRDWLRDYAEFSKKRKISEIYGIEDPDSAEYFYVVPLKNYAAIDQFSEQQENFKSSMKSEDRIKKESALASTMNYSIISVHEYLPECSYLSEEQNGDLLATPYLLYHIYGIDPENKPFFEKRLQKMAEEYQKKKSSANWRVWRVCFGADIPKYVIGIFAKSKEELESRAEELQFTNASMNEMIRRDREGKGILRKDLSVIH